MERVEHRNTAVVVGDSKEEMANQMSITDTRKLELDVIRCSRFRPFRVLYLILFSLYLAVFSAAVLSLCFFILLVFACLFCSFLSFFVSAMFLSEAVFIFCVFMLSFFLFLFLWLLFFSRPVLYTGLRSCERAGPKGRAC